MDIGKSLRERRESLGLSVDQFERQTGIPKNYITALEKDRFDLLPSRVYVRSYLRAYAKAVGEDPQTILAKYSRTVSQEVHQVPQQNEARRLPHTTPDTTPNRDRSNVTPLRTKNVVMTTDTPPTLSRRDRSHRDVRNRKMKWGFGKFYDGLLMIGAFLLMIATVAYVWYTNWK